jgi:hypothetical protein
MLTFSDIISPILMIIFIFLTLKNLKELHQPGHILNSSCNRSIHLIKRDSQLICMLLLQVTIYMITTSLYPINVFYQTITQYINKSSERIAIENFLSFQINHCIFYFNNISPFFVYYFISSTFRLEVKKLWFTYRNYNRIGVLHRETLVTNHTTDQTNPRRQPIVAVVS